MYVLSNVSDFVKSYGYLSKILAFLPQTLTNSETVQPVFTKFCDFNHTYIGYLSKLRL